MDDAIVVSSPDSVRALIAQLVLNSEAAEPRLGDLILAPHQADAVTRIEKAFSEFGGALLSDVVGSGKTFIGLAVAKNVESIVIAPASLRSMWRESMRRARVDARLFSTESLSRRFPNIGAAHVVIVDEAHHFRNPRALRYGNLSRLLTNRRILLMTATPIHNSRADLESLLSLFLGSRAHTLSDSDLGRLIIRRDKSRIASSASIPQVAATHWLSVGDDRRIVNDILALPPPIPPRDAGEAKSLAAFGLLRQWASSGAALRSAIRRRIVRAAAFESSLLGGDHPTEKELRRWIVGEDSVQLGLPGFTDFSTTTDVSALLDALIAHRDALRRLNETLGPDSALDAERARHLFDLAARHSGSLIVAFTSYEATAVALFKALSVKLRIAALTSRGGLVAGGRVCRTEIIEQFDADGKIAAASDRIEFLITTDLLSEGVNLQKADVVVHIDLPWTQARLDQRVGRLARVGSRHRHVIVYALAPPPSANSALRMSAAVVRKSRVALAAVGPDEFLVPDEDNARPSSPPESQERLREVLASWLGRENVAVNRGATVIAAVSSRESGFICAIRIGGDVVLVSSLCDIPSDAPAAVERACRLASGGKSIDVDDTSAFIALEKVRAWVADRRSSDIAGVRSSAYLSSRRKILNRIDLLSAGTPLHQRTRRAEVIRSARQAALAVLGDCGEKQLFALALESPGMDTESWLARVADVGSRQTAVASAQDYEILALLLLVAAIPPPSS